MCGIAGLIRCEASPFSSARLDSILTGMLGGVRNRGRDAEGIWRDDRLGVGLCHSRLAIIELSDAAAQPMVDPSGKYSLTFNGEVYNYQELREELEGEGVVSEWRGKSDTEVVLMALIAWGPKKALMKFEGMFALALWSERERTLLLARDRYGKKPLYYFADSTGVCFASSLTSMLAHPDVGHNLNPDAAGYFLMKGFAPVDDSLVCGVKKLPPAHYIVFSSERNHMTQEMHCSWALSGEFSTTERVNHHESSIAAISEQLNSAVARRLKADVPLGLFLSGGIDSSLVAYYASRLAPDLRSFSVAFEAAGFDESSIATNTAKAFRISHSNLMVSGSEALGVIHDLPNIYDEPLGDISTIPMVLLSRFAAGEIKVVLTGDGGDELFGGYDRHVWAHSIMPRMRHLPRAIRQALALISSWAGNPLMDTVANGIRPVIGERLVPNHLARKFAKVAEALSGGQGDPPEYMWPTLWQHDASPLSEEAPFLSPHFPGRDSISLACAGSELRMGQLWDFMTFMPDGVLVKVDRATMDAGIEARSPFLDSGLFDLAATLSDTSKVRGMRGKAVLRDLAARVLPSNLANMPKRGFSVPIDEWLRTGLSEWAGDLLSRESLRRFDWLDADRIGQVWSAHSSCKGNYGTRLYPLLMLAQWSSAKDIY